jgi:hypothetical protein
VPEKDMLALDPAYYGYDFRDQVNAPEHHNMVVVNDGGSYDGTDDDDATECEAPPFVSPDGLYKRVKIVTEYDDWLGTVAVARREIEFVGTPYPYYVITDHVLNNNWHYPQDQYFTLHGNGSEDEGSFAYNEGKKTAYWTHPCQKDNDNSDNWAMMATIQSNRELVLTHDDPQKHGNKNEKIASDQEALQKPHGQVTDDKVQTGGYHYGNHTTVWGKAVLVPHGARTTWKTIIIPNRCSGDTPTAPKIGMGLDYSVQLVKAPEDGSLYNFHYSSTSDSIFQYTNPFDGLGDTSKFTSDAASGLLSMSTSNEFKNQYCLSYTNFRRAHISEGKTLVYRDTTYIESSQPSEVYYAITGQVPLSGLCKSSCRRRCRKVQDA